MVKTRAGSWKLLVSRLQGPFKEFQDFSEQSFEAQASSLPQASSPPSMRSWVPVGHGLLPGGL